MHVYNTMASRSSTDSRSDSLNGTFLIADIIHIEGRCQCSNGRFCIQGCALLNAAACW